MKHFPLVRIVVINLLLLAITFGVCAPADGKDPDNPCGENLLSEVAEHLSIKLFPVINRTNFQVWESKFYPFNILEVKINEYLLSLFLDHPKVDAEVLDQRGMNRWLAARQRDGDMAAQIEIYRASMKTRDNVLGNFDSNAIAMRVRIFDSINARKFAERPVHGVDKRYTFAPSEGQLFFLDSIISLPVPFSSGLDLLGLTKQKYKGQKMSFPTWEQFNETSAWQAFKNATEAVHRQIMMQAGSALARNSGSEAASALFGSFSSAIGRIISPTESSTRKRREYIVSLGEMDAVSVGDVLEVVRSDSYITVDPDRPVVVLPKEIGRVKVKWVQEREAIVTVTQEKNKNDPIQLKDIVIKRYGRGHR
ncbi:MAG: hypothetical protein FWF87_01565 [Synergistaceae bacterium]|nr:hypothetical protein [Synergistaceae bacterium]